MRDEIMAVKKELEEVSLAWEMLSDRKKANKTICWSFSLIIIFMIFAYFLTVGAFLYYISKLNYDNYGYEEEITNIKTQEIDDVDEINNSNIINGDMYGESKAN